MRADTSIAGTFLDDLGSADRAALLEAGTARHYRKGEPLFVAGDAGGFVVLITEGRVKVTAPAPNGAEAVLSLRGPGDLVGELSALEDAAGERGATVVALEPVVCRVVRAEDFREILASRPAISLGLLRMVSARLRASDRRLVEYGAYDTVRRLARLLAEMAGADGREPERRARARPAHRADPGRPGRHGRGVTRVRGPGARHAAVARPRLHRARARRRARPPRAAHLRRLKRADRRPPTAAVL